MKSFAYFVLIHRQYKKSQLTPRWVLGEWLLAFVIRGTFPKDFKNTFLRVRNAK